MTIRQAQALRPGQRLSYGLSLIPSGTVKHVTSLGVKVRWDDGREVFYSLSYVHNLHIPAGA